MIYTIPPIPRRSNLADFTLPELAAILLRAVMRSDIPSVLLFSRLIRERADEMPIEEGDDDVLQEGGGDAPR